MKQLRIEKVTINIGTGKDQKRLENAVTLIKNLTGIQPVKTITQKRIAGWGLRPGLPIGCKLTLRGKKGEEMLSRMLYAKDNILKPSYFDVQGNMSFGVQEYIDIKDAKYDPKIGVMGLQMCVTFTRPGYRIASRRVQKKSVPKSHIITREETIAYIQDKFGGKFSED